MITEIKSDEAISVEGTLTSVEVEKQKSYNQALEDAEERFKKWLKSEYGMVTDENMLTIRVLRSLNK